ncbi:hypothetical protein [Yoonia sp. I 8.24]|uniref:hypothetical protein n=1 Tax=Yoonia sp. I 8.24 TaxID=1537229 RepID=UPI001EDD5614|nr:hypothetical protein [Yoonia sp. I 8.24]MCG3267246.1 hypothetical protein [Yoonia sp. I 8.24]
MRAEHEARRVLNHELVHWIAFAHHKPGSIPEYKAHGTDAKPATGEAAQARARGAMIAWAMQNGA